jgi:hypothetical protein
MTARPGPYHTGRAAKETGHGPARPCRRSRPGVIGAVHLSPLGELFRPGNLVNQNAGAGNIWAKGHYIKAWHMFC